MTSDTLSTISLHIQQTFAVTNTGGTQAQVWENSCIMFMNSTVLSGELNGYQLKALAVSLNIARIY